MWFSHFASQVSLSLPSNGRFQGRFFKTKHFLRATTRSVLRDIVAVQLFLPASEWCAQTEWLWTMGSMQWSAGYNEADVWPLGAHSRRGGHIPAFVGGVHPLSLSVSLSLSLSLLTPLPLMASCSFFLSYKHVNMHTWKHTHIHTPLTPPPPPLVLIIPLQIRRSISSCIIVSPLLRPPTSPAPLHSSRGEKLPFEPLSASLAGVFRFSHSLSANQSPARRQGPIRWQRPARGKEARKKKKANRCD